MSRMNKLNLVLGLTLILVIGIIANANADLFVKGSSVKDIDNVMVKKTEIKLQAANDDIKTTMNLDETLEDYRLVDYDGGENLSSEILTEFDALEQSPLGSTVAQYYLKKDSSAVIVLWKEADGTNVVRYAKKVEGKWMEGEKRAPGSPILDMASIKVE